MSDALQSSINLTNSLILKLSSVINFWDVGVVFLQVLYRTSDTSLFKRKDDSSVKPIRKRTQESECCDLKVC